MEAMFYCRTAKAQRRETQNKHQHADITGSLADWDFSASQ